jgi:hypothetical protein
MARRAWGIQGDGSDPGDRGVAALALTAAILSALLAGSASWLSALADDGWQTALREELKWSAAAVEDARFVYTDQAPDIAGIDRAEARVAALREVEADSAGTAAAIARAETRTEQELAFRIRQRVGMSPAQERAYRRPDGSFDIGKRLADERNRNPDLVRLDPGARQAAGDQAERRSQAAVLATIPVAGAFALAALARRQTGGWYKPIIGGGFGLLALAVLMALVGVTLW